VKPPNAAEFEVTHETFESALTGAKRNISDPCAGFFGANSMTWRVDRESALFLGAGRAALLQLAHPWVAVALEQHSSLLSQPVARFHNTFRIVFTMVFGSAAQSIAAARTLNQLHSRIGGSMPARVAGYERGSRYEANWVPALQWVFATLVESAVLAYECVLPPLSREERENYYRESCVLAQLFGIPPATLPQDWSAFADYVAKMHASEQLGVDERSRLMAQKLLTGAGSRFRPPRWYRTLTAAWIPPKLRSALGLAFGSREEDSVERIRRWLPKFYATLPAAMRFVGPFQEARARLAAREPGPVIRVSNRFWIGQSLLPFGPTTQGVAASPSTSASHSASSEGR
jgi:uncharacterized protein (DUF2236 family)